VCGTRRGASVKRGRLRRQEPQLHEYDVLQQRDVEHPAQHLDSDQRRLGKSKVTVLGAIVREYRQPFPSQKNPAIDQVATDDLVVVQVEGQTFELLIFVAHRARRCRACGRDGRRHLRQY